MLKIQNTSSSSLNPFDGSGGMTSHGILGPLGHGRSKLLFSIDRGFIQLNTACKNEEVKNRGKNDLQQKFKGGEYFQFAFQIIVNKIY